jgi:hypothetical protein
MNYDDDLNDEVDYLERRRLERKKYVEENAIKLEVNKTYLDDHTSWAKRHFKILHIENDIALGIKTWCGIYNSNTKNCGQYSLFNANTGELYENGSLYWILKKVD